MADENEETQESEEQEKSAREEAGVVENWEEKGGEEVIESGEHFDFEAHEKSGGVIVSPSKNNPYMSEEEQDLEMQPQVMGPPPYGSPDPATSAGRLLPLDTHPLRAEVLPEGHSAAISDDYASSVAQETHLPGEGPHPLSPPPSDLEMDQAGQQEFRVAQEQADATPAAKRLAQENGVDLREVEGTGTDDRITVDDVKNYMESGSGGLASDEGTTTDDTYRA